MNECTCKSGSHHLFTPKVFSGPYFPVFSPNMRKYGPEKAPYLDPFHTVILSFKCGKIILRRKI